MKDAIEKEIQDKFTFVEKQTEQIKDLKQGYNKLLFTRTMLEKAKGLIKGVNFQEFVRMHSMSRMNSSMDEEDASTLLKKETSSMSSTFQSDNFKPLTGTIHKTEQMRMKKLIYRASRGMAWVEFFDFDIPIFDSFGNMLNICLYFVIYPSTITILQKRLVKICESFMGEELQFPDNLNKIDK